MFGWCAGLKSPEEFVTHDAPILEQFMVLTTTFAASSVLSHIFYIVLARLVKKQLANPLRVRLFNRMSGGTFLVLGLSLLGMLSKAA